MSRMDDSPIQVGQIWKERHRRAEYSEPRTIQIKSIGNPQRSSFDGVTDITQIDYWVQTGHFENGTPRWRLAARPMSAFNLRERWDLEVAA